MTVDDLEAPFVSKSASNNAQPVAMPAGAMPKVPNGYRIELVAKGSADAVKAMREDEFYLDPTRMTLVCGTAGFDGTQFKGLLANEYDIQLNKTSRNSVLLQSNINNTRSDVAHLIEGDGVDAREDGVDVEQLVVHQLGLADPGHARRGVLQAQHEPAAQLALPAHEFLLGDAVRSDPGELETHGVEYLVELRRQAPHRHADQAAVGVV